jgi:dienelactone hydrolase
MYGSPDAAIGSVLMRPPRTSAARWQPFEARLARARPGTVPGVGTIGLGPPGNIRVYYPSLEGSPAGAAILDRCERYPLVLFIHGDCGGNPYAQWIQLPSELARAGYVVVVTSFGGQLATRDPATTAPLRAIHDWMRAAWEHGDRLMPSPATAVIGHSYGGTLAAQLSTEIPVTAFCSLSGAFGQTPNPVALLRSLAVPSLFTWDDQDDIYIGAQLSGEMWDQVRAPKHGVMFPSGTHGDYLLPNSGPRCMANGACSSFVRQLAADFATSFLSKYQPPQFAYANRFPVTIPDSLILRPQNFPPQPENGFYAGSFLDGFASSTTSPVALPNRCDALVQWVLPTSTGSLRLVG